MNRTDLKKRCEDCIARNPDRTTKIHQEHKLVLDLLDESENNRENIDNYVEWISCTDTEKEYLQLLLHKELQHLTHSVNECINFDTIEIASRVQGKMIAIEHAMRLLGLKVRTSNELEQSLISTRLNIEYENRRGRD